MEVKWIMTVKTWRSEKEGRRSRMGKEKNTWVGRNGSPIRHIEC